MKVGRALSTGVKAGALAATAAIGLLATGIFKVTAEMDDLAKKTRAINFPIEEFQEYRFAAQQAGVDTGVFDKSVAKFTKTVGELKGGYGAMFTALKKNNPQLLKQLQNTEDVSKAFDIYLSAIRDTPGAMNKAALSAAGFGRAGVDMINVANLGAEELKALRLQMRENGVVTAEQAAMAEEFNDTMNRVKLTIMGTFREVVVPLIPHLTKMAERFRLWAVNNRELIKTKVVEWALKLRDAWFKAVEVAREWLPKLLEFVRTLVDFGREAVRIAKVIWDFRAAIIAAGVALLGFKATLVGLQLAQVAASMTAVAGSSTVAATAVKGLSVALGAGGLVLAAAAAGVAIGLLINKLQEGSEKKAISKSNRLLQLEKGAERASLGDLQKRLQEARTMTPAAAASITEAKRFKEIQEKVVSRLTTALASERRAAAAGPRGQFAVGLLTGQSSDVGFQDSDVVTAGDRVSRSVERSESRGTVVIKDETGRAQAEGPLPGSVTLQPSGAF
jgi:hypothetical protein